MTISTVSIVAKTILNTPLPNGRVTFELTGLDIAAGLIAPGGISVDLDVNGVASIALLSNASGSQGTQYRVGLLNADGELQYSGLATVPATNCYLHDILSLVPPATVDDATAAKLAAQTYASQAGTSAAAAAAERAQADIDAQAAAAARAQADIDAQATGADRAAASASASLALAVFGTTADLNAAQQIMLGYANTAGSQAQLAAVFAASASSVVQQDLSAVAAQALHRSPNATTALAPPYDTSRDSDGGAWVDRCAHTSWFNEALNGPWLTPNLNGAGFPNELTARYSIANAAEGLNWTVNGAPTLVAGAGGYLQVDGTNGKFLSMPDSAANSVTGDIDIRVKANLTDWTPAASNVLVAKYTGTPATSSFQFYIQTNGLPVLGWSTGAATATAVATAFPVVADGADLWLRVSLDVDNGAAGKTATFYTSADGVTWNQLGATVVSAGVTSIADTPTPLSIGALPSGTSPLTGKIYYAEVRNGIAGSVVSKFDGSTITAAATGSYFQNATDGKFYSLNAGAGTTEVFRGNTAKAPRLSLPIGEGTTNAVTVFAGDQPGRPMWGRWVFASATFGNIASIACRDGKILVGTSLGLITLDLVRDVGRFQQAAADRTFSLTSRASGSQTLVASAASQNIVNNTVNAVAVTVLPDAPIDPATVLPVLTIALATAAGLSVIQNSGTVVNSSSTVNFATIALDPYLLFAGYANATGSVMAFASSPGQLGASFGLTTMNPNTGSPDWVRTGGSIATIISKRGEVARVPTNTAQIAFLRHNASSTAASLAAIITPTYNTGWMTGDIRRCWLSSNQVGAVSSTTELVTDGTFDNSANLALWGIQDGNVSRAYVGNALQVTTNAAAGSDSVYQALVTEPGVQYTVTANFTVNATCTGGFLQPRDGGSTGPAIPASGTTAAPGSLTPTITFTAVGASTFLRLALAKTQNDAQGTWDNVSCKAVGISDRSYKNKPLTITGTLAKTAVAAAAQLVFYSGWSAANYLQEAYSADLDPGTGGVTGSIWGTIPVGVAAAGWAIDRSAAAGASYKFGHDASGKLVATVFDGTTTRTATTTAAFNTGLAFKARFELSTSGTLTIKVNGVSVASTTGAPMLTLTNAAATCTVGIDRGLTAPWAGSLALVKVGMTAPTQEQSAHMYQQESFLFQPSAQCTLPDGGAVVDLAYDDMQDRWKVVSAANESSWTGLVRTSSAAVSAGSFTKAAHRSAVKLLARSTTNPGVDVTIPAYGLREELVNRAERAAALARLQQTFDFDAITAQTDFTLPVGYTAIEVLSAGASKREGATKDYTRLFDGFRETIRFAVAPGNAAWVQIIARRAP